MCMVTTNYEIMEDDTELSGTTLIVYVSIDEYEDEYLGTDSRGEDHFDRKTLREDVFSEELTLQSVWPAEEDFTSPVDNGEELLRNADSHTVRDMETVDFTVDGVEYVASFDPEPIEDYRY